MAADDSQRRRSSSSGSSGWLHRRSLFIDDIFGRGPGVLPTKIRPDAVHRDVAPGVDALVWNMAGALETTSTVFHARATSGIEADTALIFHQGHHHCRCGDKNKTVGKGKKKKKKLEKGKKGKCQPGCVGSFHSDVQLRDPGYTWWDLDNITGFGHSLGLDVFIVSMPLWGVNFIDGWTSHGMFLLHEAIGEHALRYFCEPSILTINYALQHIGTKRLYVAGLSGGGWAATAIAAMDPRVSASFNIGGSIPWPLRFTRELSGSVPSRKDISDFESICGWVDAYPQDPFVLPFPDSGRPACRTCDFECQYTLAGMGPGRYHVQILHEHDRCCYATSGRHEQFLSYESTVRSSLANESRQGWFTVVATDHNIHEVCDKDKRVIAAALDLPGPPGSAAWDMLPCDVLHAGPGALSC